MNKIEKFKLESFYNEHALKSTIEFTELYYNLPQSKTDYADKYYRIYGLNKKTYQYVNIPKIGTVFRELYDLHLFISENNFDDFIKLNIVEYDTNDKKDSLVEIIPIYHNMHSSKHARKLTKK